MSKVRVTSTPAGLVVVASENNPDYGYIRVEQSSMSFTNGWAQPRVKSALLRGLVTNLQSLNFKAGQEIEGKIVIKEGLTPTNPNDVNQDMKLAGASGVPCTKDGQPIYRTAFYTEDMSDEDVYIAHDNRAQIQAAQTAQKIAAVNQPANLS